MLTSEMLQARLARLQKADVSGVHPENQADAWNEIEFEIEVLEAALAHLEAAPSGEGEAYRGAFMSPSDSAEAVCRLVLAMTEGAPFDDEDRRMALTADSELAGMCRAAIRAERKPKEAGR